MMEGKKMLPDEHWLKWGNYKSLNKRIRSRKKIFAELPNAGMANLLFTWAKARVFAKTHSREYYVFGWSKFHLGPYLRGERVKRYYGSYFKSGGNFLNKLKYLYLKKFRADSMQIEPLLENANLEKHFVFDLIPFPDKKPYFHDLWHERDFICESFNEMLREPYKLKTNEFTDIGVHIRRGDFVKLKSRFIPDTYYVDCIKKIRSKFGADLEVTIYTDGYADDVKEVLALPKVKLSTVKKDILEFQALSSCKILITSFDSTFGYWAGFMSDAHIILHPRHFGGNIRALDFPKFEGTVDEFVSSVDVL